MASALAPPPLTRIARPKPVPRSGVHIFYVRITFLVLAALLLVGAYAGQSQSSTASTAPRFEIGAADVAKMSMKLHTNPSVSGQGWYSVQMGLSSTRAADFEKFTQLHLNHKVLIVLGTNVIAEPLISSAVTNGVIRLHCPEGEIKKLTEAFPKR